MSVLYLRVSKGLNYDLEESIHNLGIIRQGVYLMALTTDEYTLIHANLIMTNFLGFLWNYLPTSIEVAVPPFRS